MHAGLLLCPLWQSASLKFLDAEASPKGHGSCRGGEAGRVEAQGSRGHVRVLEDWLRQRRRAKAQVPAAVAGSSSEDNIERRPGGGLRQPPE